MINTRAFVAESLKPWDSARCNCVSAVASAVADAPKCAAAFSAWLEQPTAERRRQARAADVVAEIGPFADQAALCESARETGWGVISLDGRQVVALKVKARWLVRLWPSGVLLVNNPCVIRQWEVA